jgi:hypothetical protein
VTCLSGFANYSLNSIVFSFFLPLCSVGLCKYDLSAPVQYITSMKQFRRHKVSFSLKFDVSAKPCDTAREAHGPSGPRGHGSGSTDASESSQ